MSSFNVINSSEISILLYAMIRFISLGKLFTSYKNK